MSSSTRRGNSRSPRATATGGRSGARRRTRASSASSPSPHGHNYMLEVTVRGAVDARTGMVMDLAELKRLVGDAVVARFDHADLNADPLFAPGRFRRPRTWCARSGTCWFRSSEASGSSGSGCGRIRRSTWSTSAREQPPSSRAVYHFSAGHRLVNPALTEDENARALRPVPPPARTQLLPRGHGGGCAGSRDRHVGGSRRTGRARSSGRCSSRVDHYDLSTTVPALDGRHHHWRESGPRVLAVARAPRCRRTRCGAWPWSRRPRTCSSTAAITQAPRGDHDGAPDSRPAEGDRRGSGARGPGEDARARGQGLRYLTSGYRQDVNEVLNEALFTEEYDEMVVVKDIDFYSRLRAPPPAILWQVPHRLHAVAEDRGAVQDAAAGGDVQPAAAGAGAADHPDRPDAQRGAAAARAWPWSWRRCTSACSCAGVEKQNSKAVTSAMLGAFRDRPETRAEFMELIKSRGGLVI